MDLNKVNIIIRPRPSYEGLDLGFAMATRWFLTLWVLWLLTALPLSLVISALCYHHPIWALGLIWWLKPLYETPLLYWVSRKIFGEKPGIKTVASSLFSIVRPKLLSRLTVCRLSPCRSFFMPVILLENMRGKDYTHRIAVLGRNESAGFTLTFICALFELMLFLSAVVFFEALLPQSLLFFDLSDMFSTTKPLVAVACNLIYTGAMSVVAPYYVVSGFALYLNRRIHLEAWDIELNFKRLLERKKNERSGAFRMIIAACMVSLLASLLSPPQARCMTKDEAGQAIGEVLKQDDFGKKETVTIWKLKERDTKEEEPSEWFEALVQWLVKWLVLVAKPLLWIAGGVVLVLFAYLALKYMGMIEPGGKDRAFQPPKELFGLKLTADSLPGDIPGEALKLLKADDVRGALSLLYRGTLYKLIYVRMLDIPKSSTEGECMELVAGRQGGRESDFFNELTRVWQNMAYGHIRPETGRVHDLCHAWRDFYSA